MPPHGALKGKAKPRNAKMTLKRLIGYMRVFKTQFYLVIFFIMLSVIGNVGGTYLIQYVVNAAIAKDYSLLLKLCLFMGGTYFIGACATYAYSRIMLSVSTKTLNIIRDDMFIHMQKLPIRYFDTRTHGEIMSRYTNDTDTLREMLTQGVPQLIASIITVVGVFVAMLILSPLLTLFVIAMLCLMLFAITRIGRKSGKNFINQQKSIGKLNGYVEEMIEGQKVIKVFCHEDKANENFEKLNEELRVSATKAHTYANILMPIMGNLSYLNYAMTAAAGAILLLNGYIANVGVIASFLQYTRQFAQPLTQISQLFNSVIVALAGAERIFEMLDEDVEQDLGNITLVNIIVDNNGNIIEKAERTGKLGWKIIDADGSIRYQEFKGRVEFIDVTFGYNDNDEVLKNINLYAKSGQKIALVGTTGAGKTTITNLINRFYDIEKGSITYDNIDIKDIKKSSLRASLAMVLQDTHLFTGTVLDNIRYGRLDASYEEVIEAAKLANAHSFIEHLPDKYDTMLTADGANLSQGQRQLLAIARAAVSNPALLILDEATSSIDTRTESYIEKGMDTLMEDKTVFVIAHRLSTVRNANAILVLENGKIIERGDHEELINKEGKYYKFYMGMYDLF